MFFNISIELQYSFMDIFSSSLSIMHISPQYSKLINVNKLFLIISFYFKFLQI